MSTTTDPKTENSPAAAFYQAAIWAPKLKALADENRLGIALLLAESPHTVKELQEATGLSQALVSHHLKPLREHDLVLVMPKGRSNVYTLCCDELELLIRELTTLTEAVPRNATACSS